MVNIITYYGKHIQVMSERYIFNYNIYIFFLKKNGNHY
jgi:hypothetical protein